MKQLPFIVLLLILLSCKDKEAAVVDFEEVMPTSENYKEGQSPDSSATAVEFYVPSLPPERLADHSLRLDSAQLSGLLSFPDRFTPTSGEKFTYRSAADSVHVSTWGFRDSLQSMNVFLNWMNCFGKNCKSVRIGSIENMRPDGFLMLLGDTSLVFVETNSTDELNKWKKFYTADKEAAFRYVLQQGKRGKTRWWMCSEGTLKKIPEPIPMNEP